MASNKIAIKNQLLLCPVSWDATVMQTMHVPFLYAAQAWTIVSCFRFHFCKLNATDRPNKSMINQVKNDVETF